MTSDPTLIKLLDSFRQYDNYADRLTFWQKNDLTETLSYTTQEFGTDDISFKANRSFLLRLLVECRTWEDLKQWPVLTITPFTRDDARCFIDWALLIRPNMSDAPQTADAQISGFEQEYLKQDFEHLKDELISKRRQDSHLWLNGRLHQNYAMNVNMLRVREIDPELFERFMQEQAGKRSVELASQMRLGKVDMSWEPVDTYLFAKAKYDFAVYLEKFDPADITPPPLAPPPTSDEKIILTHSQIAILYHYKDQLINSNNADEIARQYGQTSGQRLEQTYQQLTSELNRTAKGKYKVRDIEKVLPLLTESHKVKADKELRDAKANNIK